MIVYFLTYGFERRTATAGWREASMTDEDGTERPRRTSPRTGVRRLINATALLALSVDRSRQDARLRRAAV